MPPIQPRSLLCVGTAIGRTSASWYFRRWNTPSAGALPIGACSIWPIKNATYEGFLEFSETDMAALTEVTARLLEDAGKLVREV